MAKLTVTAFVSLDGVMQAPGGPSEDPSGGFEHGGWLVPHFDEDVGGFMMDVFSRVDAFLLGRRTYQIFAAHWPRVTDPNDPIATALNELPKHVASKTLESVDWKGAAVIPGDVVEAIAELKKLYPRELQVHGSASLIRTLAAHDLVDEYNVLQFPVILGRGKRLFEQGAAPLRMTLSGATPSRNGVVMCTYRRVGELTYGSFALET